MILELIDDPDGLERLYREHRQGFAVACRQVLAERPDSVLLRAWRARLEYEAAPQEKTSGAQVLLLVLLCLLAGSLYMIPEWTSVTEFAFFPRYAALVPFAAMGTFTLQARGWPRGTTLAALVLTLALSGYMGIVPSSYDDTYILACLHLPFFLWCVYGLIRMGEAWRDTAARIEYIRFFGEMIIHAGLLFIGGGILLLLAGGLVEVLGLPISWVHDYMALYGLAAIPVVSVWATDAYSAARRIAPLMARIFAPLLLVLIVAYMVAMAWNMEKLFEDRDTLLVYNILLFCVLATAVFTLTGRGEHGESRASQRVTMFMLGATLVLDVIGVAAVGWRMVEYGGITANRLAVLGSNLAVLGNLAVLFWGYLRHLRGIGGLEDVEHGQARYLPVYAGWTLFVIAVMPWLFGY